MAEVRFTANAAIQQASCDAGSDAESEADYKAKEQVGPGIWRGGARGSLRRCDYGKSHWRGATSFWAFQRLDSGHEAVSDGLSNCGRLDRRLIGGGNAYQYRV
ncbi:hypothetical protein GCM10010212_06120 [Paenarthrobacter nicotinovorans]|nr:hypothetical protein GCM10010212_06120 [Paenarthrobacter nicotinovorans]